jgi:hypothetical protein
MYHSTISLYRYSKSIFFFLVLNTPIVFYIYHHFIVAEFLHYLYKLL